VFGSPSTAADAGVPAPSVDEAVAGFPCDSRVCAAGAALAGYVTTQHAMASRMTNCRAACARRACMASPTSSVERSLRGVSECCAHPFAVSSARSADVVAKVPTTSDNTFFQVNTKY